MLGGIILGVWGIDVVGYFYGHDNCLTVYVKYKKGHRQLYDGETKLILLVE